MLCNKNPAFPVTPLPLRFFHLICVGGGAMVFSTSIERRRDGRGPVSTLPILTARVIGCTRPAAGVSVSPLLFGRRGSGLHNGGALQDGPYFALLGSKSAKLTASPRARGTCHDDFLPDPSPDLCGRLDAQLSQR